MISSISIFRISAFHAGPALDQEGQRKTVQRRRRLGRQRRRRWRRENRRRQTVARGLGRVRAPGVPGVHVGAVPDRAGHHAQAVLPGQDVPGLRHGGRLHGAHVARLPAGVLAERHGPAGHAAVVADAVAADRLPGAGGVPRAAGRGHVPAGLPVEARGGTGADRDAGDAVQQPAAVAQHTARPRGPPFPVVLATAHHGRE